MTFRRHAWRRDPNNPVFPPGQTFDSTACMNPFVLRRNDEYWMFYAGGDEQGHRRICLAIAAVTDLTGWKRLGPLFDLGARGAFDDAWCVLPCVHFIGGRWHLYYTGRSTVGSGLQSFRGIGLATSSDLLHWTRHSAEPILTGDAFPQWLGNKGIAGGGRIQELDDGHGQTIYRMHFTLATGTPSKDLLVDQAKRSVCADSCDGLNWHDRNVLLSPRLDADHESAATIALNVWRTRSGFRAIYAGIGPRFGNVVDPDGSTPCATDAAGQLRGGAYSICEARSDDGRTWERGAPGDNLSLPPSRADGNGHWASEMTEYPNVIEEDGRLRLFYCGNGYGRTGIGTALAEPVEPLA